MASDITWEKAQQILGPNLKTYRTDAQVQTITFKTFRNNLKRRLLLKTSTSSRLECLSRIRLPKRLNEGFHGVPRQQVGLKPQIESLTSSASSGSSEPF